MLTQWRHTLFILRFEFFSNSYIVSGLYQGYNESFIYETKLKIIKKSNWKEFDVIAWKLLWVYNILSKNIFGFYNVSGDAGDSLAYHNGMKFSTKDRDNDLASYSCAQLKKGGWWYNKCHHSNLNGLYLRGPNIQFAVGVIWYYWRGDYYSLQKTEMKIRL